jgi:hypothetical protein
MWRCASELPYKKPAAFVTVGALLFPEHFADNCALPRGWPIESVHAIVEESVAVRAGCSEI